MYGHKVGIIFTLPALLRGYGYNGHTPLPQSVEFLPGVSPILRKLDLEGYKTFVIVNVPEVYTGSLDLEEVYYFFSFFQHAQSPVDFHQIYYETSPYSTRFMPKPGMVKDVLNDNYLADYEALMVGATQSDIRTAKAAKVEYRHRDIFFSMVVPRRDG